MTWIDQICVASETHGASDIYLMESSPPQFRLNGSWTSVSEDLMPGEEMDSFWIRCGGNDATLDRDCGYKSAGGGRFRVNLFRSLGRRGAVLRLIKTNIPTLEELGLPAELLSSWIDRASGLVLVTGRTGSGKSTSLASCLEWINQRSFRHIVTIEDPIEFLFVPKNALFSQREVGLDTDSFAEGLRRALRQSPDVVMVGEIRDAASARTALQAAETGHLVLASVHSQNVPETLERLVQLFPSDERPAMLNLMAGQINGIVTQYLLPSKSGGLELVCEFLENGALARKLIREGKGPELADLIAKGDKREMQSLLSALVDKCKAGLIAEETALAFAPNSQEFNRYMRGISGASSSSRR